MPGASNASSLQQKYNQGLEDGGCILGPPNCGAHGDAAGCGCTCHAGWSTIERQDPLNYRHCSVKETVKVGTEQRVDGSRELEEELKTRGDGGAEESNWPLRSLQVEDWVLIFLAVIAIGLLMHRFYTNRQQSRARPPDAWKTTSLSYPHQDQVVIDEGAEDEDSVQAHMPEEAFADYFMHEPQQDQAHRPPQQDTWRYWQQLLRRPSFARAMRAQEHDPMGDAQVVEIQPEIRRIRGAPAATAEGG